MVTSTATYDWREDMRKAAVLKDREAKAGKAAGQHLWKACQAGIEEWIEKGDDPDGENLYGEFLNLYGESRKGDCSKMKTVALAVANNGLQTALFDNLSQAYGEARRLTKTAVEEAAEDDAAEVAVEAIAESAPKTATTPESAAMILLSKGVDGAVVAILDALNGPTGENNVAAHRSFLRAVTTEVSHRIKPVKAEPTEADEEAKPVQPAKKAAAPKAKPAASKAKPVQSKSKGDANKRPLPPKDEPVEDEQDETFEDIEPDAEDMFAEVEEVEESEPEQAPEPVSTPAVPVSRKVGKARPAVKRPAVRR